MSLSGPIVKPRSGNKPKQLVVFLHGLGANGDDLISLSDNWAAAMPDAEFISPNAPFPCDMAAFGFQWFSLQDWSPRAILTGAKDAAPILNAYIDDEIAKRNLKPANVSLVGFSQGTMMALYAAPRRTEPLAGVLGYSGALIGAETLAHETKSRMPVCLIHGVVDTVVPFGAMGMAEMALRMAGFDIETSASPHLAHGIDLDGIKKGGAFLRRIHGLSAA